ncbi:tripartite tricarboxylate transporter TctB family protein [Neomoorella mulderi]|uniref:Tripartite tricarboxylate transporter TctB family protein n=1 Tax=Moorella mulderi DSM 14980 TaxID=1122241 RepID=A0A151AW25_9FIRM|nr:tripartite tricarboxylate transporter TctB family protein [Moorella mulderi]KYH31762.1 tripartite tricarboxylate transporter TctB family protein [Moorella mulderi DSM 14980]
MKDWAFVTGFLIFALFLTISSWNYPFVSAIYPRLLLICGFVLSIIKIVIKLRNRAPEQVPEETGTSKNLKKMWIYLGNGILYVLLMPVLGFTLSTFVILIALLSLFGIRFKTTLGVAICSSAILYIVFVVLLGIPLPRGIFEELLS